MSIDLPSDSPRATALRAALASAPDGERHLFDGATQIARRTGVLAHDVLVVLGSGLVDCLKPWGEPRARFPLGDLVGVHEPVADGHGTEVLSFDQGGLDVLVYTGRTHLYEGLGSGPVCLPAQIAAACGVRAAVLTNANGCLRDWSLGDVVTIKDHMNFSGASPFSGPVFTDVSGVWDAGLSEVLSAHTQRSGVYALMRGPEYQTIAESRFLAGVGADVVGMSTVLEAIALHQAGVQVCGMSVVSDLSFAEGDTDPSAVVEAAARAGETVRAGVEAVLKTLA
ncbi:MAG: purine-nucleoside phosphorylase [Actinomycetaceae bacterium]|nr:purine-nucleoside phosphorylase [Actinomycetaceae bacterium]